MTWSREFDEPIPVPDREPLRTLTAAIFRWLDRVAADPELPAAAFRLGYVISQHINRTSHQAWPSQETLRDAIGLKGEDGRSVRRLTTALANGGYLVMHRGRRVSLTYKLALDRSELSYQAETAVVQGTNVRPDEIDRSNDQDRTLCAARTVDDICEEFGVKQRHRRDLETRARARINGAAFQAVPEPAHNTGIRLQEIIQNRAELNLANDMLRRQLSAAAEAAASESERVFCGQPLDFAGA